MTNNRGFSLVELITVIGIITILIAIAGVGAHDWIINYNVEKQTKMLYADLMNARASALQRNRIFFVALSPNQYSIYEDTNPFPDGDGALQATQDRLANRTAVSYALSYDPIHPQFDFSSGGLVELASGASYTIRAVSTGSPSFDCIVLAGTRLIMGKWNGSNCIVQ